MENEAFWVAVPWDTLPYLLKDEGTLLLRQHLELVVDDLRSHHVC